MTKQRRNYKKPKRTPYGRRAYAARKAAGLSQTQLAKNVGCQQTAIYKLETHAIDGSVFTAQIAHYCNVNPYWLATGKGERNLDKSSMSDEAAILGLAWQHLKTSTLRARYRDEILSQALR